MVPAPRRADAVVALYPLQPSLSLCEGRVAAVDVWLTILAVAHLRAGPVGLGLDRPPADCRADVVAADAGHAPDHRQLGRQHLARSTFAAASPRDTSPSSCPLVAL
jgi:hypothetical protein